MFDIAKAMSKAKGKAGRLIDDSKGLHDLKVAVTEKMANNTRHLNDVWEDMKLSLRLIAKWVSGEYRQIESKSMIVLVAALLYFLNPFDFIPDLLIHIGLVDDIAVLTYAFRTIAAELRRFRLWETKGEPTAKTSSDQGDPP